MSSGEAFPVARLNVDKIQKTKQCVKQKTKKKSKQSDKSLTRKRQKGLSSKGHQAT
jgi:hypothetical protein